MTIKILNLQRSRIYFIVAYFIVAASVSMPLLAEEQTLEANKWLKARFGEQHQALIPIVAVADMVYSCQQDNKIDNSLTIKALITQLDRNALAEKLISCLAGESAKSDLALNYGLKGCFHEQLADLSLEERQQKMSLVTKAITALSRSERQKSFTQCVTEQAIHYLR